MTARSKARVIDGRLADAAFLAEPRLQRLLEVINADGEETRVVGGAIRNALLGEPVADVDLATTASPELVASRCVRAGLRTIPTGIEHGTVSVLVDGVQYEITTLREDIDTDGRRATVRFGRDFHADALRRDFTINALSVDREGRLYDYVGGLDDIAHSRVRFIGDARQRIREDYLRVLRLFRFHAAYGDGAIDAEAFNAAVLERSGLSRLSRERVQAEIMKLLVARHAAGVVADMTHAGLLGPLVAGIVVPARLAAYIATETARNLEPDVLMRLAAACVLIPEDAARLRDMLRLSNLQETRLARAAGALGKLHGRTLPPPHGELVFFLYEQERRAALDGLLLAQAESGCDPANERAWASAYAFLRDTPEQRLPVSGADIMARGLDSGPAIGAVLKSLQAMWIRAGFPKDPELLAKLVDDALNAHRPRQS
ncbi:CCA tRNA nucleotidyltransferase [Roseiarcaceae bacterium H3SJ34-1]|uniref:CCA tRNA nucleotidyltransferase n=1 Tax=Terripilifer ovatus TaxID=3032367 RepID=UPI003AB9A468|nr:CCA tRNA nucleotidyltransferase [Roseiarcaceae bacterium H3SJ34-1]